MSRDDVRQLGSIEIQYIRTRSGHLSRTKSQSCLRSWYLCPFRRLIRNRGLEDAICSEAGACLLTFKFTGAKSDKAETFLIRGLGGILRFEDEP
jgi:hypothetical protein